MVFLQTAFIVLLRFSSTTTNALNCPRERGWSNAGEVLFLLLWLANGFLYCWLIREWKLLGLTTKKKQTDQNLYLLSIFIKLSECLRIFNMVTPRSGMVQDNIITCTISTYNTAYNYSSTLSVYQPGQNYTSSHNNQCFHDPKIFKLILSRSDPKNTNQIRIRSFKIDHENTYYNPIEVLAFQFILSPRKSQWNTKNFFFT